MTAPHGSVPGAGQTIPISSDEARALFAALPRSGPLLLAVSGGPDSTALMHLVARWAAEVGAPAPCVATVDHGLREVSHAECAAVLADAASLGLSATVLRCTALAPGPGLQQRARAARYRLLVEAARAAGAVALVTAHTLDDQAETVLMRLCDGSGPKGLAAMRAIGSTLGLPHHRPLLGTAKARLMATCEAMGLSFFSDPSNSDPQFARGRLRRLAPMLADEGLSPQRLARLARRMGELADMVEDEARSALAEAAQQDTGGGAAAGADRSSDAIGLAFDVLAFDILAFDILARRSAPVRRRALAIVIGQALSPSAGSPEGVMPDARVRLERLEALDGALMDAFARKVALRRTLGGFVLSLGTSGVLTLRKENRRPGAANRSQVPESPVDSLGKGGHQD